MNKNTVIGILLIVAILIGYGILSKPTKEEIEAAQIKRDSIAQIEKQRILEEEVRQKSETQIITPGSIIDSALTHSSAVTKAKTGAIISDTEKAENLKNLYGSFAAASEGEQEFISLENDLIKLSISTLGGRIYSIQLKEFQTYDSLPLILFDGDSTIFGLSFFAQNRSISTNQLFYTPTTSERNFDACKKNKSVSLRLYSGDDKYIEYVYSLEPNSYIVNFHINLVGMNEIISENTNYLTLNWEIDVPQQEKGADWESNNTTIYYKYFQDEVDYLTERADKEEELKTKVKWIAFKQQFFSSVLIADDYFLNAFIKSVKIEEPDIPREIASHPPEYSGEIPQSKYIKKFYAEISLPYQGGAKESIPLQYYFGPNHFKTLKKYDLEFERLIPLGWGIFGWLNRFAIIPLFNFLGSFISSYGLIILILTIIIKIVLFPLTYKSYLSTAKMRVLKPQIDEVTKKIPKDKSMVRQQETMKLYKKAGVNPMGGCLPMLIQFPILIALFRFFPSSIELRQQSFLWADDLSSYDSILNLPFDIPFYGDHVSLFTLLMAASMILTTKYSGAQAPGSTQMPGMKMMMYMMPVMMLLWFNNYSSGLSYYYFLANIITFAQTLIIRRFVDDEAILKKLKEAKKKPAKKSKFQERLEKMARQRGYKK